MSESGLNIETTDTGVRIFTLNRPDRLNAIHLPMIRAFETGLQAAAADNQVRAILLRGAGRAFCAGDDIDAQAEILAEGEAALRAQLASLQQISDLLTLGDKPTVVAAKGWAMGAGLSWVLNCDFAIWGVSAKGGLPEVGLGTFVTGGATWLLPQIAGRQFARDMLFFGRRIDAEDAAAHGMATKVVPDGDVDAIALEVAIGLAQLPSESVRHMKRALTDIQTLAFRAAIVAETEACVATTLDPIVLDRMRKAIGAKH